MAILYDGSHSIYFVQAGELEGSGSSTLSSYTMYKHSWQDFHLVPTSRPHLETPEATINLSTDTISSKVFDLTDRVAGGQTFGSRQGEWDFIVDHDRWNSWSIAKRTIENYINGKRLYVILSDDRTKAYRGRLKVVNWEDGSDYSHITIGYDLDYTDYSCSINFN